MCNYTSFRGDQEMGIFACSLWSNPRGIEHQELFFFLLAAMLGPMNTIPDGPQNQLIKGSDL